MPAARNHTRRFVRTVSPGEAGTRLDAFVGSWLREVLGRPLSRSAVRKLIMAGAIRQHGRPVRRPGTLVGEREELEARVDPARLEDRRSRGVSAPVAILYEDDDLVAVAKPAGVVMHRTADAERPDLFNAVRQLLAGRVAEQTTRALPYLGLHHRLDVETSGVVLFTKQERANRALAVQFERGEVAKTYHAIAGRPYRVPERTWRVENRLAMAGTGRHARMREATGGARAVTEFAVVEALGSALLVEARPATGRKHQIRAHLAHSLAPILGDGRYGGAPGAGRCQASRVMLHAWRLSLLHPVTGVPITVTCPYPPDFTDLLACLRRYGKRI